MSEQHRPLPDGRLLNHSLSSGRLGSWASAGVQSSSKIRTIRITSPLPSNRLAASPDESILLTHTQRRIVQRPVEIRLTVPGMIDLQRQPLRYPSSALVA